MASRPVLLLSLFGLGFPAMAQVPQAFTYQAVVRDADEAAVANAAVGVRLSILQGSEVGPAVYVETHMGGTNVNGLLTLPIGTGTVVNGSFPAIDWAAGPYFLKSETDALGGTNYTIAGTAPLLSVPFALYAETSGSSLPGPPGPPGMPGPGACDPNDRDSLLVLFNNSTAWGFHQDPSGAAHWTVQAIGGTNHLSISSRRAVVLYNSNNAYAFSLDNAGQGGWTVQALSGTNHSAAATDRTVVLYNNSTAYAFHVDGGGAGTWTVQAIGGTNHGRLVHGNKVILYNSAAAWAFSVDDAGNGSWSQQPLGGTNVSTATTR